MGKAIKTNGIGSTSTDHLNLTRSMADKPKSNAVRTYGAIDRAKIPYAGREKS